MLKIIYIIKCFISVNIINAIFFVVEKQSCTSIYSERVSLSNEILQAGYFGSYTVLTQQTTLHFHVM